MKSTSLHEYNVSYRIRETCALLNAEASTPFMSTHSEASNSETALQLIFTVINSFVQEDALRTFDLSHRRTSKLLSSVSCISNLT